MQLKRTKINKALSGVADTDVVVKGWVRSIRNSKNVNFIALNDGSTINNIQIVVDVANESAFETCTKISTGACIAVSGKLVQSQGKGQSLEIIAGTIEIYGEADAETYPLQKKGHSLEFLREIAHLRPRTNTFGAVLRIRHAMAYGIHKFFNDRGFFYIHAPIITASDAEGAGEMFKVTTLDLNSIPKTETGEINFEEDFFGRATNLTVSGQLESELAALALSEVYTFGPTFRAENSNTTRHLAEFWMIEPEMAFYDLDDNQNLVEEMLKYLVQYALDNCADDIAFLNQMYDKELLNRLHFVTSNPFKRLTYTEAIEILKNTSHKFEFPVDWGTDLQSEHERYLVEKHFQCPVILTDYPKHIKAFYMKQNPENPNTVLCADLIAPEGVGEIIGGSEREEDFQKIIQRIKEEGLEEDSYSWYLDLRKYGSVPHSGFGLGLERLIAWIAGLPHVRECIPYPRLMGRLDP
jgi:asparaginyl-tRNA synthetase